jgi:hypothetical protein
MLTAEQNINQQFGTMRDKIANTVGDQHLRSIVGNFTDEKNNPQDTEVNHAT